MAAAAAVGAGMQAFGAYMQNQDAAAAEDRNAQFLQEQAEKTKIAYARKLKLLEADQKQFTSKQQGAFVRSGIGFNGTALDVLAQSQSEMAMERFAARQEAEWDIRMIETKAAQSRNAANSYRDPFKNFLQVGGSLLGSAAQYRNATASPRVEQRIKAGG